jgi:glucose/arabinose dehydrogenase
VPANITENIVSAFIDDLTISFVEPNQITPKVIAQNLKNPWEIVWGADNYIWFTERTGAISRLNPSTHAVTKLITIQDCKQAGTGGLLGMALHPQFLQQPYLYVLYNYDKAGKPTQKVVRYTYKANALSSPTIILDNLSSGSVEHHGSRLLIVDNYLFITTGDAGGGPDGMRAQDLNSLNGKVLRINLDGSIPASNPRPGSAVWSYGFRNSQGMVFANNRLYTSEHGPDSDDEVNIIEKGRNYGWPSVLGFCDKSAELSFCNAHNVKEPLKAWTPTIAPSGMDYYSNSGPISQWRNSLLLCTLKGSRLMQLKLNSDGSAITDTKEFLTDTYGRLRDVCVSPQGKVYVCTDNGTNDKIIEISPQ